MPRRQLQLQHEPPRDVFPPWRRGAVVVSFSASMSVDFIQGKTMKKFSIALVTILIICSLSVEAKRSHAHYGYQGGHYASGHGSSHKGGHYVNPRTGNHYTHHH